MQGGCPGRPGRAHAPLSVLSRTVPARLHARASGGLHSARRSWNKLTALPESFGQLTALQHLRLSRASACAEWRCCCGPWTVELGER